MGVKLPPVLRPRDVTRSGHTRGILRVVKICLANPSSVSVCVAGVEASIGGSQLSHATSSLESKVIESNSNHGIGKL